MLVLEDFTPGRVFPLADYAVTREAVVEFAAEFDPQPFHLDEAAGAASMLGGLSASGWHVAGIMMRMICDAYLLNSTSQGSSSVDHIDWKRPVKPGDVLSGISTVLTSRVSAKKPFLGLVTLRTELQNQDGETTAVCEHLLYCLTRQAHEEGTIA